MNISKHIKKLGSALMAALIAGFAFTSCSTIFDYEGDCSFTYHVKFKYDKNMLYADAFSGNVSYVSLYAFDAETGLLVYTATQSGDALKAEDYTMPLEVTPGTYDLLAWCGSAVADNKVIVPEVEIGKTTIEEVDCVIDRIMGSGHTSCLVDDMGQLYHGKTRVTLTDDEGKHIEVLSLTKNTNNIQVILQHLSGEAVDPAQFQISIHDNNGSMNYDNTLNGVDSLTYHPWYVAAVEGGVSTETDIKYHAPLATRADKATAAIAEMTIGRLYVENDPILHIYNVDTKKTVLKIPLKDYALMIKGHYNRSMSDQDFLDREDKFALTFFLDELGNWVSATVIINSWHLVLNDAGTIQ